MKKSLVLVALLIGTPAMAWDPVGDVTSGKVFSNVAREGGKIIRQGQTDISNGLDRIDPRITQIGRDIDRWRLEFQSSVFTRPALEQWLWASRNSAIGTSMPMPWNIRQALQGWYPDNLLNKARFKVGDGGALNLANNSIRYGGSRSCYID